MTLSQTVAHLYPSANPLFDYAVSDAADGNGPFIERWDEAKLGPQPKQAELDAVTDQMIADAAKLAKAVETKALASKGDPEATYKKALLAAVAEITGFDPIALQAKVDAHIDTEAAKP